MKCQINWEKMIKKLINNNIDFSFDRPFTAIIGAEPSKGARSPILWNAAFKNFELDVQMYPFDVSPQNLENLLIELNKNSHFLGGAVAVPYKEKISTLFKTLHNTSLTQEAVSIGAINSIYRDKNNHLIATNTDGEAALKTLVEVCNNFKDMKILLIGVGGAGKAVATYISNFLDGGQLFISARKKDESMKFINSIKAEYLEWPINNFDYSKIDVLVNCTILGSKNTTILNEKDVSCELLTPLVDQRFSQNQIFKYLNKKCVFFDIIYDPSPTYMLKEAQLNNFEIINGLKMNLDQAAIAFNYATFFKHDIKKISLAMKNATR